MSPIRAAVPGERIAVSSAAGVIIAAIALFGIFWLKRNRLPLFTPTELEQTHTNIINRSESFEDDDQNPVLSLDTSKTS
ncbi:hypothetical protein AB0E44_13895 [Micrococcus terreus]|uniref:hypothetical protein n=1 Tax=Micrococcus terreus TaxID=574650 RepID=UPI0033D13287